MFTRHWAACEEREIASLSLIAGACSPLINMNYRWLNDTPVLFSIAEEDRWIDRRDVHRTLEALREFGAELYAHSEPGGRHEFAPPARRAFRELIFNDERPPLPTGFGNVLQSEALPGALLATNSPFARDMDYRLSRSITRALSLHVIQIDGLGFIERGRALNNVS